MDGWYFDPIWLDDDEPAPEADPDEYE